MFTIKNRIFKYYKFLQLLYFSIKSINIIGQSNRLQSKNILYVFLNQLRIILMKKVLIDSSRIKESFIFLHQL